MQRRSGGERQAGAGQQRGVLSHAPAEHDGRHAQDRQCAQASRAPGGQQRDDGESAGRREDDERQRPVGESVEQGRVGAADLQQRRERERSGDGTGEGGAPGEIPLEAVVPAATWPG